MKSQRPAFRPGGVLPQLVEDLLHLERRGVGLDQHGGADGAARDAERRPGPARTRRSTAAPPGATPSSAGRSTGPGPCSICRSPRRGEVEREVHQAARRRLAVHQDVLLRQVPAAGPHDDRGQLLVRLAARSACRSRPVKSMVRLIASSRLSCPPTTALPLRRVGVLVVREPDLRAGVQRVDRHLPVGGAGDLQRRSARPGAGSATRHVGSSRMCRGLGQEVQRAARRQVLDPRAAALRAAPAGGRRARGAGRRSARAPAG